MLCLSCKKTIAENAKFCNFCGANQAELKIELAKKAEQKEIADAAFRDKARKYLLIALAGAAITGGAFFAYNKAQGENLGEIKTPQLSSSPSTTLVQNLVKGIFKDYIPSHNCYFVSYIFNNNREYYCLKLVETYDSKEGGKDYIYATLTGTAMDEDKQPAEFHAASGIVEFVKFRNEGGKLKVVADSGALQNGTYGNPGNVKILPIGKDNVGWAVVSGYAGMGYVSSYIDLYAITKDKVQEVLGTGFYANSKDACAPEDKSCAFKTADFAIRQDKNNEHIYPLKVSGSVTSGTLGQSSKSSKNYVLTYDQAKGQYKVPSELTKFVSE